MIWGRPCLGFLVEDVIKERNLFQRKGRLETLHKIEHFNEFGERGSNGP